MAEALAFEPWAFVCLVSLAGSCGAALALRFDGVAVTPLRFVFATIVPAGLALVFVDTPIAAPVALWTFFLVCALSCLTVIDAATRTVPDILSVPMIVIGVAHAAHGGYDTALFAGFAVLVVMLGLMGQVLLPRQSWIGGGDVLLVAGALAWFGPALLPDIMLLTGALLCARMAVEHLVVLRPLSCVPIDQPDPGVPLAPSLGAAQLLIWFGGPLL